LYTPKFILSLITRDNDYQREQARTAEEAARRANADLEILYADSDAVTQSSQLLEAIHRYKSQLTGILVEPTGGTGFPQVARAAVSAGVAWVMLNRDASLEDLRRNAHVPVFAVSSNHKEVGRLQARQLSALLPDGGTVLCIQGPSASSVAQQRLAGLEEAKGMRLALKVLKSANWTEEGGFHVASSWLRLSTSQQQSIAAVAAHNDVIALGVRRAFEEARQSVAKLPFIGVDGLPRTGQAFVQSGALRATVVVPAIAGIALEKLAHAVTAKAPTEELYLISSHSFPSLEELRPKAAAAHA
jgi:ABC-type sugar transport system substrate-binding protein